jgi:hypothetical protein
MYGVTKVCILTVQRLLEQSLENEFSDVLRCLRSQNSRRAHSCRHVKLAKLKLGVALFAAFQSEIYIIHISLAIT